MKNAVLSYLFFTNIKTSLLFQPKAFFACKFSEKSLQKMFPAVMLVTPRRSLTHSHKSRQH